MGLIITASLFLAALAPPSSQPKLSGQEDVLAIKAARMVDVRTGTYLSNPVLLVREGRISQIGFSINVPAGAKVIDLANATLLPGLIDSHTHLLHNDDRALSDGQNLVLEAAGMSTAKRALLVAKLALEELR